MLNFKRGYTVIELIITLAIIGVLVGIGSSLLVFFTDNFLYLPPHINLDMSISRVLDTICEGDDSAGGLRFAQSVTGIGPYSIEYVDSSGRNIEIELDSHLIKRSIDSGPAQVIPYYVSSASFRFEGQNARVFQYYDEYGNITTDAGSVKRVEIILLGDHVNFSRRLKTSISFRRAN